MDIKIPLFVLCLAALCGCSSERDLETKQQVDRASTDSEVTKSGNEPEQTEPAIHFSPEKNNVVVNLPEFDLKVENTSIYFKETNPVQSNKDTTTLWLEIGETLEGKEVALNISRQPLSSLTVQQQYRTSLNIEDQGVNLWLKGFKHYYSDWEDLEVAMWNGSRQSPKLDTILVQTYTENQRKSVPEFTKDELLQELSYNDEYYVKLGKNITPACNTPCQVVLDQISLKVTGTSTTGGKFERTIVFVHPVLSLEEDPQS